MKHILIHSQQSVTMLVKQLIQKLNPAAEFEVRTSILDIDPDKLTREDIVFLLQEVGAENAPMIAQLKMRSTLVGSGQTFPQVTIFHTIPSSIINTSSINELAAALETTLYNINNKVTEVGFAQDAATSALDALKKDARLPKKVDLVIIGVSTGGPAILQEFLKKIIPRCVPILIVQHLPKGFSSQLSEYLNEDSQNTIVEVATKTELKQGQIALAQSGFDAEITKQNDVLFAIRKEMDDSPFHPSVDRTFLSASTFSENIVGVVLTGMGKDGTIGSKALHDNDKIVIAQEPSTCVVDGMPRSVIEAGLSSVIMSPTEIIQQINTWSKSYE